MTPVGIGRGRGWGKVTQDASMRRPGQPRDQKDELLELIRNLDINDVAFIENHESPVAHLFPGQQSFTDENKRSHEKFYKEALEDRDFARKFLMIFKNKSNKKSVLMQRLQKDYERREELFKQNPSKFGKFVCLLGDFYEELLKPTVELGDFLNEPIVNCLQILLDSADESGIQIVVDVILRNGAKLFTNNPAPLSSLMLRVRQILVTKNLSAKSRGMLLFIIDYENQNYQPLPMKLMKFYSNQLGQDMIFNLAKYPPKPSKKTKPDHQIEPKNDLSNYSHGGPGNEEPEVGATETRSHQLPNVERTSPKLPPGNSTRPRAIRGSGANELKDKVPRNDRRPHHIEKEKPSDAEWSNWKQDKGTKSWPLDDQYKKSDYLA